MADVSANVNAIPNRLLVRYAARLVRVDVWCSSLRCAIIRARMNLEGGQR